MIFSNTSTMQPSTTHSYNKYTHTYTHSCVSANKSDINMQLAKAWTAFDRLSIIWKSNLSDKIKRDFFQAAVVSILLHRCTSWTLTKRTKKKLDRNYARMLGAIMNNIPQYSTCTVTYLPFLNPFKSDEPGIRNTAGETKTNS